MGLVPANEATKAVLRRGGWPSSRLSLKKKSSEGEKYKILKFQRPDCFHTLRFRSQSIRRQRVQEESSRDQALQTEANTFLVSSPVAASNMLGFEVRFPLQRRLSALPGNRATRRDLEIMSFPRGRRCCSGSPENILSDWLVFYSPLSRPGVCC